MIPKLSLKHSAFIIVVAVFVSCGKKEPPPEFPVERQAAAPLKAPPPQPTVVKVWVETDPVKCKGNPWDTFKGLGGITGFFAEKGVKVYDTATLSFNQLYGEPVSTCRACNCPDGTALFLWVAGKDAARLQAFGFKLSRLDPLNPNSYVGSRRAAGAPPLPSRTPGPSLMREGAASTTVKTATSAKSKKRLIKKKRRTR